MSSTMIQHPKVTAKHLARKAVVYLRQSSDYQVQHNLESQRLQYALVDRAKALGFEDVEVIDTDLGASASIGSARRDGFGYLTSLVAFGKVGIVLSREASRLSRTDKDWCHLLEVCQLFDTLLGDGEQVYDLDVMDDQLILGIKGTLSVVELKVLRMRLAQGVQEKARRGELYRLIAPGYVGDGEGGVVKDPDLRVQQAIELVFNTFRALRSIRQTFRWFHHHEVELPVNRPSGGHARLVWKRPTLSFINALLHNPFYAGAYVWGARPTQTVFDGGIVKKRAGRRRAPEACEVFIRDHHPGYIGWAEFEENRRIIRGNQLSLGDGDEAMGAPRGGRGLLAGLLRCGRCGRKLYVRYSGKRGTNAMYFCKGDFESGGRHCIAFGGATVDQRFGQELLEAISPLGVEASLGAIEQLQSRDAGRREALLRQVQQLDYERQRAFEQYDEVDPRNRLAAAELERRWNRKLEACAQAKAALEALERVRVCSLSEEERDEILGLGKHFEWVWNSEHCAVELKKTMIRSVVEEVIAEVDEAHNRLRFLVHWKGGTHTRYEMPKLGARAGRTTALEDLDVIRRMAVRYGDDDIARVLNKLGRRTATGLRWNEERVTNVRRRHAIDGQRRASPDPEILTRRAAAQYCGVSAKTIGRLVAKGVLSNDQVVPWAPWEIRRTELDAERTQQILRRLHETGRLHIEGDDSATLEMQFD